MNKLSDFRSLSFDKKLIYLVSFLIFIYPLFGSIFRHWFSGVALLIVLLGILYVVIQLFKNELQITYNEKWIIVLIPMLFVSYLVSAMVNGWNENQLAFLGGELNFLFFTPLYLIVSRVESSAELLIKGTIISGITVFFQFVYQILILDDVRVTGAYGHLFIGPVSVLIAFISISSYKYLREEKLWRMLIIFSVIGSLITAAYSTSGTAYVLILLLSFISPFIIFEYEIKKVIFLALAGVIILSSYSYSSNVKYGFNRITNSLIEYSSLENRVVENRSVGTAGERIELWLAGVRIFKDNIFFGVGRNNFILHAKQLVEDGYIAQSIFRNASHPHNIYVEILVSKGLFGFIILLLIIYSLIQNYINAKKLNVRFSDVAITHLLFILIVGVGSEAPLIKNNFVSIFLIYSAVFFSWNNREMMLVKMNKN